MHPFIVYADLNCPFSYAYHARLKALNLLEQVEFRLIEHAQDIGLQGNTPDIMAELASEVFTIRGLAHELPIALPPKRPDSRFANLSVIADPARSQQLREVFFQALWVDGLDISDPATVFECLEKNHLPTELAIDSSCEAQLDDWQNHWESNLVGAQTPITLAPDGRRLKGLADDSAIQAFFAGAESSCEHSYSKRQKSNCSRTLAVLASEGVQPIWPALDALRHDYNLLLPCGIGDLRQQLETAAQTPDLILIAADDECLSNLKYCQNLLRSLNCGFIPTAIIGARQDDQQELEAYALGASDFLPLNRAKGILLARIQMMLDLKRSREFLEHSARIDGLTGVANRRELESRLEKEWRRGARTQQPLSVIMVDVDHFKAFNDRYGHLAGDSCLQRVAQAIQHSLNRSHDGVFRYGGEEFAVLLPDTDSKGAQRVAEVIRHEIMSLAIPHDKSSVGLVVTASQGVASLIPNPDNNPYQLISIADSALYQAKAQQRNCVIAA